MNERKKRNIIIGSLCAVLLLMVVGYAAFQSVLKINGTSNITSNWDIKITKITSNVLKGNATNASDPTGVNTLTASFETNLVSPGDSMEYVITVTNSGSLDATLEKITMSQPDNEYVTFAASINGETITAGENMTFTETTQTLNAGESKDITVQVTFKDVTISKMEPTTSKLTLTLDYAQADGSGIVMPSEPTAADKLIDTAVTTGDGLYQDEYETGRYFYRGTNPNNYITFNDETWRILSVENDGTLKIMKKDSIGKMAWDTNDATTGRNNDNNTYCQISSGIYAGCNAWSKMEGTWTNGSISGTVTQDSTLNAYLNNDYYNSLSSEAQSLIQTHTWGVGQVTPNNTDLAGQIASENGTTWNGNIGLMSASEFLRANTNTSLCGTYRLNATNYSTCKTTNYIVPTSGYLWTISPDADKSGSVFDVRSPGFLSNTNSARWSNNDVIPALYLTSNINLDGEGTESNPYTINE